MSTHSIKSTVRLSCEHVGCNKSYLRAEHLKRHRLTHQNAAFQCCICSKHFTRNDLLHAHLRRHEKQPLQGEQNYIDRSSIGNRQGLASNQAQNKTTEENNDMLVTEQNTTMKGQTSVLPSRTSYPTVHDTSLASSIHVSNQQGFIALDSSIWPQASDLDNLGANSADIDMSWSFQNDGIFGLPSNSYMNLSGLEYFDFPHDYEGQSDTNEFQFLDSEVLIPEVDHDISIQAGSMPPDEYRRLVAEFPDILSASCGDNSSLLKLFNSGLDYVAICMPFLHRATLNFPELPTLLILVLCSLGGIISKDSGPYETGILLYRYLFNKVSLKALESARVDVSTLQTMVLIEHIGFYGLSRSEHEVSDVFHAMIVTVARRSSLLARGSRENGSSRISIEQRWKDWANRETYIRLAYSIFVHDIDYSIHFMHPILLTTGMLKLPLPCSPELWGAKTAIDWYRHYERSRHVSRGHDLQNLKTHMEVLLPTHCDYSHHRRREILQHFSSSAFIMQILIHALASAVYEHQYRSLSPRFAPDNHIFKSGILAEGIACWYNCFQSLQLDDGSSEMARSALLTYHLVSILLRESLSDMQMAAGTAYSWGRAVTPQRAQESFLRLVTTNPVRKEAYYHALEVVTLGLNDHDIDVSSLPSEDTTQAQSSPQAEQHLLSLYLSYNAFIGVLVLWAYALGLSRSQSSQKKEQAGNPTWVVANGKLRRSDIASPHNDSLNDQNTKNDDVRTLKRIMEEGFAQSKIEILEVEKIKDDVRRLIRIVRNRLNDSRWHIVQEAQRVLDGLLEKNGFMD